MIIFKPSFDAADESIQLDVVKLPQAKVGERNCCLAGGQSSEVLERMGRFRRKARDYERMSESLVGFHLVAFAILMLKRFVDFTVQSA